VNILSETIWRLTIQYVSKYTSEAWGTSFVNERKLIGLVVKDQADMQSRIYPVIDPLDPVSPEERNLVVSVELPVEPQWLGGRAMGMA
jgi:hypothetical protein